MKMNISYVRLARSNDSMIYYSLLKLIIMICSMMINRERHHLQMKVHSLLAHNLYLGRNLGIRWGRGLIRAIREDLGEPHEHVLSG